MITDFGRSESELLNIRENKNIKNGMDNDYIELIRMIKKFSRRPMKNYLKNNNITTIEKFMVLFDNQVDKNKIIKYIDILNNENKIDTDKDDYEYILFSKVFNFALANNILNLTKYLDFNIITTMEHLNKLSNKLEKSHEISNFYESEYDFDKTKSVIISFNL